MPPVYPFDPNLLDNLAVARGYVDVDWPACRLSGWILCPEHKLDYVKIFAGEKLFGQSPLQDYEDVAGLYPTIPHARRSAFNMELTPDVLDAESVNPISVLGYDADRPVARRDAQVFDSTRVPPAPIPPAELIGRMQDGHDPDQYRMLGFLYFHQLRNAMSRHGDLSTIERVLDFGCGSGRVLANFSHEPAIKLAAGADIDADAIGWARANLPRAEFRVIDPVPLLPYSDAAFDAVIALAVFAAFGPDEQATWLPEFQRVIAPGGLLLVSIQGTFSASFLQPQPFMTELRAKGIICRERYHELKPALGLNEYLGVYQTRAYTWRHWSPYFEILEHLVGEIGADQDLVVMRRRTR